jgi:hypothetical protein
MSLATTGTRCKQYEISKETEVTTSRAMENVSARERLESVCEHERVKMSVSVEICKESLFLSRLAQSSYCVYDFLKFSKAIASKYFNVTREARERAQKVSEF